MPAVRNRPRPRVDMQVTGLVEAVDSGSGQALKQMSGVTVAVLCPVRWSRGRQQEASAAHQAGGGVEDP
jgi:hypothetical protein